MRKQSEACLMLRNLGRTSWVSKNIGMFFGNNTKIQGCVRENGEWMRERERERDWERLRDRLELLFSAFERKWKMWVKFNFLIIILQSYAIVKSFSFLVFFFFLALSYFSLSLFFWNLFMKKILVWELRSLNHLNFK